MAIAIALVTGLACGLGNGLLVTFGRLPSFIATLGMMSVARGAALMLAEGRRSPASARIPRAGDVSGADGPTPVIITGVIYPVAHFVLGHTVFGRATYAIGGNEEAARLSGVHVRFHKTAIYGVAGLTSAAAAVILTARLDSAQPTAAPSMSSTRLRRP